MSIATTIIPVFIVIFVGLIARRQGFLSTEFTNQANRLVYHLAIPAMVFLAIAKTDLHSQMNITVICVSLGMVLLVFFISWLLTLLLAVKNFSRGSFIQCSFHGNLGYIGFAIAFYFLGDEGLVKGAIIASFVMIVQNILAILVLQYYNRQGQSLSRWQAVKTALGNPVILSAVAGILFSLMNLELPLVIDRALSIIKGMALPLALLIIGATLSFEQFKSRMKLILFSSAAKLIVMPGISLLCFTILNINRVEYLPAIIILAAPSATLTYVMAMEIGGDPELAGAAISFSTLVSAMTYTVWLAII